MALCALAHQHLTPLQRPRLERAKRAFLCVSNAAGWERDMEQQWCGYFETQIAKYRKMTRWEVLHDIREEFERMGINPYRRLRYAGVAT